MKTLRSRLIVLFLLALPTAAWAQRGDAVYVEDRLNQIQQNLTALTGQLEQMQYRNQQLQQQMEKMQADYEYRLDTLEKGGKAGPRPAGPTPAPTPPAGGGNLAASAPPAGGGAGPQGEATFEWPIRILAVYDDPVTCRAMEGVLQAVFEHPLFAEDGESAMALAGERAFDVIFIDTALQGIDGYAVCGMLRQIAMHHDTPVVLVTDRDDASALADAKAWGANDLISKPLLAAEVTLQALIFALRYRLSGGGATPRNAAGACISRLLAEGNLPEDCGIVCGTDDTEILHVVTRN